MEREKRKTAIEMALKNHGAFSEGEPFDAFIPNVVASILGKISLETGQQPNSDLIDRGLFLLRKLNEIGLDVSYNPQSQEDSHE